MFGLKKSPADLPKHNSADPGFHKPNPFDSDNHSDNKLNPTKRTSSEPSLADMTNPFDEVDNRSSNSRHQYKNNFQDSGGVEKQSVQELEGYAVYKAEETTKSVQGCLKVAEEIRSDATRTLVMLHDQGEQITRTHHKAVEIDHDLSRGEKLLGSLGGMFSKTWKPNKTGPINGPVITRDHSPTRRVNHLEKSEKLGLSSAPKAQSRTREPLPESADAYQRVEMEKAKQDDGLSDLSDLLGELKNMAVDMGNEIGNQIYYQLDNYYQNHRRYVKSRSDQQLLHGREYSHTSACEPEEYSNGLPIVPCGLIAWSMFNDTFTFARESTKLKVGRSNIAWKSDREHKFGKKVYPFNFQNGTLIGGAKLDPKVPLSDQEDFIVWMRAAALLSFRKLYGRIEEDLEPGNVVVVNLMNNYNTYSFSGQKKLILSTSSWLGGRNDFLGITYIVVGASSIIISIIFTLLHLKNPRPYGDNSWNKKSLSS